MQLTFYDPGQLRKAMTLEEPVETPDDCGGFIVTWIAKAFVWAHLEPAPRRVEDFAARRLEEATHKVTLRWRADVTDAQRLTADGKTYRIMSVTDTDGTKRYLTCRVQEERP